MCSLASFKAQAGMSDGPNGFLTFKLLSISNISLVVVYLNITLCRYCGPPDYYEIDTVLFYQNIHITLKIYSWEDWQYHFHWSKPFQNCFWVLVFLCVFSQFLNSLIKFHLSLTLFKFWNTSSRCFSFSCFKTFLLLLFDVFANFFTVFFYIHCWCSVSLGLSWRMKTVFCGACFLITVSNDEQNVLYMISGFSDKMISNLSFQHLGKKHFRVVCFIKQFFDSFFFIFNGFTN